METCTTTEAASICRMLLLHGHQSEDERARTEALERLMERRQTAEDEALLMAALSTRAPSAASR
jgi:hypothetical protein